MAENENTHFRDFTMRDLADAHDKDRYDDDDAYEFSNGRKFKSTDRTDSGVYDGT